MRRPLRISSAVLRAYSTAIKSKKGQSNLRERISPLREILTALVTKICDILTAFADEVTYAPKKMKNGQSIALKWSSACEYTDIPTWIRKSRVISRTFDRLLNDFRQTRPAKIDRHQLCSLGSGGEAICA
jgi:hypothetical protein